MFIIVPRLEAWVQMEWTWGLASSNYEIASFRPKFVIQYTIPSDAPPLPQDWTSKTYTYSDDSHKHAVTSVDVVDADDVQTTNTYEYDANGRDLCTLKRSDRET